MRMIHAVAGQLREIHDLWCKFRGNCDVEPSQDDRIDWLREQQLAARRERSLIRNYTGDDLEDELFGPLREDKR